MNKFFKLYINENIKLFKRQSSYIFIILAVITLFIAYGIAVMNKNISDKYVEQERSNEILQSQIDGLKDQLKISNKEDDVIVLFAEKAVAEGYQVLSFDLP